MKTTSNKSLHQFARYVLVGGFNTVFGYGLFALLNWLFTGLVSYSYMYAAALANIIAITVAFLGYKWFVFRTRGITLSNGCDASGYTEAACRLAWRAFRCGSDPSEPFGAP